MTPAEGVTRARLVDIRTRLDEALVGLRRVQTPELNLPAIEGALSGALQHVYSAMAGNESAVVFREQTRAAVAGARDTLELLMQVPSDDEALDAVTEKVARCLGDLQSVRWVMLEVHLPRADRSGQVTMASHEVPRLLDLARDVLRPAVPLSRLPAKMDPSEPPPPEVLPAPPRTLEEVLALAAQHEEELLAFSAVQSAEPLPEEEPTREVPTATEDEAIETFFGRPITTQQLLAERARDMMDDLGMFGRMRRCTDPEEWASGRETERRMLLKVDGLAACGGHVFHEVVRLLDDRPMPDPELTFGNLFFFGSVAGDDSFDQLLRLLRLSELDDREMRIMVTDALVLAPHPRIDEHLPAWLTDADPNRRLLAVDVLRRRRTLTVAQLDQVGNDPDTRVLASLARAIPTLVGHPAIGALGWFLDHHDEGVVREALGSAMRMCRPRGAERARRLTEERGGAWAEAALFTAISGGSDAYEVLMEAAAREGQPTAYRALGWFGDPRSVPFLLGRLRDGDDGQRATALDALERITGAGIVDAGIVPEYDRASEPFRGEPREYEPPGLLDGDPDAWAAWWERWGRLAERKTRYRWGRPYSLAQNLHELRDEAFIYRDRPWAHYELAARGRVPLALDEQDLVVRQEQSLDAYGRAPGSDVRGEWVEPLYTPPRG